MKLKTFTVKYVGHNKENKIYYYVIIALRVIIKNVLDCQINLKAIFTVTLVRQKLYTKIFKKPLWTQPKTWNYCYAYKERQKNPLRLYSIRHLNINLQMGNYIKILLGGPN